MPMDFSFGDGNGKKKNLMKIPEEAHLVINGCEIEGKSRYYIDRESNIYIYLEEIDTAVESEHSFACDDNGEPITFEAKNAKRITVLSMEEAVEKLSSLTI